MSTIDCSRLELCRVCFELRGPGVCATGNARFQRCLCEPDEPRWPRFDYNRALELCWLCGVAVIPCGSKFSGYFCGACNPHVERANGGRVGLVPVGRHTLMNGIDGSPQAPPGQFERRMEELFARIQRLSDWSDARVVATLRHCPGAGALALPRYLEVAGPRAEDPRVLLDELVPLLRCVRPAG